MAVRCVRKYEASDGKLFDTQHAALGHDALVVVRNRVESTLKTPGLGQAPNMMAIELVNNVKLCTQLRDDLNKTLDYHRNYGKLKKKPA